MSSPSEISRGTAMISARGTITSAMRRSRSPRMFRSMTRSVGEKPVSPAPSSSTSARPARMLLALRPNNVRNTRANQLSPVSRSRWLGSGTGTGRLRVAPPSFDPDGSGSGMADQRAADLSRPIGIRNVEASEDRGLEPFHHLRLLRGPVIIADEVKEPVHGKMREVLRKRLCLHVRFALKRLIRNDNVAEQARLSGRGVSGIDREGQHVGRHILLAPVAIEHAHGLVIAEHDGNR